MALNELRAFSALVKVTFGATLPNREAQRAPIESPLIP
ncbi:uncharacterized protein G2W53_031940 [Senna tora]|uniref:Uncharacterized protein n=1 Tax=Senna tora TaxID=362788 RepID=A0A834WBC0_9FABA|nr:uncharacterized protein G2W53_031940 [Senna tora]